MRVTGKYIFISMFLEADIGLKVQPLQKKVKEQLDKTEERDFVSDYNLINGVKDQLKKMKVDF